MRQEKETEPSLKEAWDLLKNSVSYLQDSHRGKFDVEIYMRRLSPVVDDWILRYEKESGDEFRDGFCDVSREGDDIVFLITLHFIQKDGSETEKQLRKRKSAEDFIGEGAERVRAETLRYEIQAPRREG